MFSSTLKLVSFSFPYFIWKEKKCFILLYKESKKRKIIKF